MTNQSAETSRLKIEQVSLHLGKMFALLQIHILGFVLNMEEYIIGMGGSSQFFCLLSFLLLLKVVLLSQDISI